MWHNVMVAGKAVTVSTNSQTKHPGCVARMPFKPQPEKGKKKVDHVVRKAYEHKLEQLRRTIKANMAKDVTKKGKQACRRYDELNKRLKKVEEELRTI